MRKNSYAFSSNRNECGLVAFAHTLPEYRGTGLGKIVIKELTRKIIEGGETGACFVVKGNAASISMLKSCGYKEVGPGRLYSYIGFYNVHKDKLNQ